ncbi:asparaginase [Treponema sp. R80B11-R83G3]
MIKKRILFLGTGGTIASENSPDGATPQHGIRELINAVPKITELCDAEDKDILCLDSSNMQPEEWKIIAEEIYKGLNSFNGLKPFDGVVITHGTDTMAYTSSMLSFMLKNLNKPVILTGSQHLLNEPETDAKSNLLDAVRTVIEGYPGVYIVFNGKIIKGTRASKINTKDLQAFESINECYAGKIIGEKVEMKHPFPNRTEDMKLDYTISTDVFLLKLIPGMSSAVINQLVDMRYRGIVIEAFGLGGLPNIRRDLIKPIENAINADVAVVVMTQCRYGTTDLEVYDVGKKALKTGIIPVSKITVEAAVTKLMWVLGHTNNLEEVSNKMKESICGEMG